MSKFALYVPLKAKPGKEKEVADFLRSAVPLVNAEPGTRSWFAIQEGPGSFAIFDTFDDEAGRDAHLKGKVAEALMAKVKAGDLFEKTPDIHKMEILADKLPEIRCTILADAASASAIYADMALMGGIGLRDGQVVAVLRVIIAARGGSIAVTKLGGGAGLFAALATAMVVYGLANIAAVAGGTWFKSVEPNPLLAQPALRWPTAGAAPAAMP